MSDQQVTRDLLLHDDNEVADPWSALGIEKSPQTLSFIHDVQSAVAQIEDRLASQPSAHPPPPVRTEIPHSPPGPQDSFAARVQFLEASLSLTPPASETSLSRTASGRTMNDQLDMEADSAHPESSDAPSALDDAVHPEASDADGVTVDDDPISRALEFMRETASPGTSPVAPAPIPSIAPIVKQFEDPNTPDFARDEKPGIFAAPIAPIVNQFEALPDEKGVVTEKTSLLNSNPAPIAPIVEQFEGPPPPVGAVTSELSSAVETASAPIAPIVEQFDTSLAHSQTLATVAETTVATESVLGQVAPIVKQFDAQSAVEEIAEIEENLTPEAAPITAAQNAQQFQVSPPPQGIPATTSGAAASTMATEVIPLVELSEARAALEDQGATRSTPTAPVGQEEEASVEANVSLEEGDIASIKGTFDPSLSIIEQTRAHEELQGTTPVDSEPLAEAVVSGAPEGGSSVSGQSAEPGHSVAPEPSEDVVVPTVDLSDCTEHVPVVDGVEESETSEIPFKIAASSQSESPLHEDEISEALQEGCDAGDVEHAMSADKVSPSGAATPPAAVIDAAEVPASEAAEEDASSVAAVVDPHDYIPVTDAPTVDHLVENQPPVFAESEHDSLPGNHDDAEDATTAATKLVTGTTSSSSVANEPSTEQEAVSGSPVDGREAANGSVANAPDAAEKILPTVELSETREISDTEIVKAGEDPLNPPSVGCEEVAEPTCEGQASNIPSYESMKTDARPDVRPEITQQMTSVNDPDAEEQLLHTEEQTTAEDSAIPSDAAQASASEPPESATANAMHVPLGVASIASAIEETRAPALTVIRQVGPSEPSTGIAGSIESETAVQAKRSDAVSSSVVLEEIGGIAPHSTDGTPHSAVHAPLAQDLPLSETENENSFRISRDLETVAVAKDPNVVSASECQQTGDCTQLQDDEAAPKSVSEENISGESHSCDVAHDEPSRVTPKVSDGADISAEVRQLVVDEIGEVKKDQSLWLSSEAAVISEEAREMATAVPVLLTVEETHLISAATSDATNDMKEKEISAAPQIEGEPQVPLSVGSTNSPIVAMAPKTNSVSAKARSAKERLAMGAEGTTGDQTEKPSQPRADHDREGLSERNGDSRKTSTSPVTPRPKHSLSSDSSAVTEIKREGTMPAFPGSVDNRSGSSDRKDRILPVPSSTYRQRPTRSPTATLSPRTRRAAASAGDAQSNTGSIWTAERRKDIAAEVPSPRKGRSQSMTHSSPRKTTSRMPLNTQPSSTERRSPITEASSPSRLPRVAVLASGSERLSTVRESNSTPSRSRLPRGSTFSGTVPRAKSSLASVTPVRKKGMSSSPVTPRKEGGSESPASLPRSPLRRTMSFTHSRRSTISPGAAARAASAGKPSVQEMRGSPPVNKGDRRATLSMSAGSSKPPKGGRQRITVPQPFSLSGPELQEKTMQQLEESRRKAAEVEARRRVFKARPMPDFSRPFPKPHK